MHHAGWLATFCELLNRVEATNLIKDHVMRVIVGGILHESSTFTVVPTTWDSYLERFFLTGNEIITTLSGTNTAPSGFIDGAKQFGFEVIPTVYAEAHPSMPTPRPIFDAIVAELLERIRQVGKIDGVLLELHGSMVVGDLDTADGLDDAEGHILTLVRELIGDEIPIVVALDIHANMSPLMVEKADVLLGRKTYPEVDMAARGRDCAAILHRIMQEGVHPTMALRLIPMIWGMNQVTDQPPMNEAIAYLREIESRNGVICGSIAVSYYLADVPFMGSSVYVVTDNDATLAQKYADELADWCCLRRAEWHYALPRTKEAIEIARNIGRYPAIFADTRDNTGGGSPGDSTGMLHAFIEAGLEDACILYIVDHEAIAACHSAGVGAELSLKIGGKSSPLQGEPIPMNVEVVALSDGHFKYSGPMYAGLESTMGLSAYVRQGGLHVILVSVGEQPYCTAFAQSMGLDPRQMRYIGVKSTAHFRAGFGAWAGSIQLVDEPSLHGLGNLPYRRLGRKVYPLGEAGD